MGTENGWPLVDCRGAHLVECSSIPISARLLQRCSDSRHVHQQLGQGVQARVWCTPAVHVWLATLRARVRPLL